MNEQPIVYDLRSPLDKALDRIAELEQRVAALEAKLTPVGYRAIAIDNCTFTPCDPDGLHLVSTVQQHAPADPDHDTVSLETQS